MDTVTLLGYRTSSAGLEGDVAQAWNLLHSKTDSHYIACSNPHSLVEARRDPDFSAALANAEILLPDGIGIVLAAKLLGLNIQQRVAGSEFFMEFSRQAQARGGVKYFFIGSTDRVLALLVERLQKEFPDILVCGVYSPPFKDEFDETDNIHMINRINMAKPDVLWVGMTAPKQEKWIYQNRNKLRVPLVGAIGAVFDFYAGTKKRAPDWVCKIGLEWLPRFLREPKRLFRRNFISSPLFLFMVLQEKFRKWNR